MSWAHGAAGKAMPPAPQAARPAPLDTVGGPLGDRALCGLNVGCQKGLRVAILDSTITIALEQRGGIAVLSVGGVVDIATGPALGNAIDGLLGDSLMTLIIDLSE